MGEIKENLIKSIINILDKSKESVNPVYVHAVERKFQLQNKIFISKKKYFDYLVLTFVSYGISKIEFLEQESQYGFNIIKEIYFLRTEKVYKFFNKLTILQLQSFLIDLKHFFEYKNYIKYARRYHKRGLRN